MRFLILLVLSVAICLGAVSAEANPGVILNLGVVERNLPVQDAEICQLGILADTPSRTPYGGDNLMYSIHDHIVNSVYGNLSTDIRSASDPNRLFNLVVTQDNRASIGSYVAWFDPAGLLPTGDVLVSCRDRSTGAITSFVIAPIWGEQRSPYNGGTVDATVAFPASVPEPSSLLGLLAGTVPMLGLVVRNRRR